MQLPITVIRILPKKIIAVFVSLFISMLSLAQVNDQLILIRAGKLYDPEKNVFLTKQEILVQKGKILKVGTGLEAKNAKIIDLSDCTITPGLIDAHTHVLYTQRTNDALEVDVLLLSETDRVLRAVGILRSYLDAGFTTIRDVGNSGMFLDLNLTSALKKGWLQGPTMLGSGPIMSPEGGQFWRPAGQQADVIDKEYRVIRGVEDAKSAVRHHIMLGADLIKIVADNGRLRLSVAEMKSIVDEAHANGLQVTAHATFDAVVRDAVNAGVDGIEHGYDISDSTLTMMAEKKVYLVPTDGSESGYRKLFKDNHSDVTDEQLKGFITSARDRLKRAYEKKVMIVAGSDMYIYSLSPTGESAKDMLVAYLESGIPVKEVLKAATLNAARALKREGRVGTIKEGLTADIVAFKGDLEKDFKTALYKVEFVMTQGRMHVRP